ncbi:MAG: DUF1801 domain-containing protein [Planctomycetota bacterium]|jgi:hypothetical protein|nr:DUF1801 domain-containing protein [Planctomycetota bacterium]MDG1406169.1 DUF1801 domain-containing protein [Planctomycetota bacterium]
MSQNKTQKTKASVAQFLNAVEDKQQRADSKALDKMMKAVVGRKGAMWGESIVGFGDIELKYASGRELEWFKIGYSPRKGKMSLYLWSTSPKLDKLLDKLGKHKRSKGCLYINKLADVDVDVLQKILELCAKDQAKC